MERINRRYPHLDFLFAILNSYLKRNLRNWTKSRSIKNIDGKPIAFKFINTQKLFHECPQPERLFVSWEVGPNAESTHRNPEEMQVYFKLVKDKIGM